MSNKKDFTYSDSASIKKVMQQTQGVVNVTIKMNSYVSQAPHELQNIIRKALTDSLTDEGYSENEVSESVQDGMDSRLINLEDTIDIHNIIKRFESPLSDTITEVVRYLSESDSNGSYDEMINDYYDDEITLETVLYVCKSTLNNWKDNHITSNEDVKELEEMINRLARESK